MEGPRINMSLPSLGSYGDRAKILLAQIVARTMPEANHCKDHLASNICLREYINSSDTNNKHVH